MVLFVSLHLMCFECHVTFYSIRVKKGSKSYPSTLNVERKKEGQMWQWYTSITHFEKKKCNNVNCLYNFMEKGDTRKK